LELLKTLLLKSPKWLALVEEGQRQWWKAWQGLLSLILFVVGRLLVAKTLVLKMREQGQQWQELVALEERQHPRLRSELQLLDQWCISHLVPERR
jgi:hypothetical protein